MATFKPGDKVQLKSGGPVMTVAAVPDIPLDGAKINCQWFSGSKLQDGWFNPSSLVSANDDGKYDSVRRGQIYGRAASTEGIAVPRGIRVGDST